VGPACQTILLLGPPAVGHPRSPLVGYLPSPTAAARKPAGQRRWVRRVPLIGASRCLCGQLRSQLAPARVRRAAGRSLAPVRPPNPRGAGVYSVGYCIGFARVRGESALIISGRCRISILLATCPSWTPLAASHVAPISLLFAVGLQPAGNHTQLIFIVLLLSQWV
jgi:hypothetical protein